MSIQLTPDETEVLNAVIPTVAFSDHKRMQDAMRDFLSERNAKAPEGSRLGERELKLLQGEYLSHIHQFLLEEAFFAQREGHIFFLTEKGRHLKQQKSLAQYYAWKEERGVGLRKDLHTIATRGYLDQDEVVRNKRRAEIIYKIKKFILYPLIGIIILLLVVGVAHSNGWDKSVPSFRNWLDKMAGKKGDHGKGSKDKDDDDDDAKGKSKDDK